MLTNKNKKPINYKNSRIKKRKHEYLRQKTKTRRSGAKQKTESKKTTRNCSSAQLHDLRKIDRKVPNSFEKQPYAHNFGLKKGRKTQQDANQKKRDISANPISCVHNQQSQKKKGLKIV